MGRTILFAMHQEIGHLNPTFKLSRTLKRRGHDVQYFAIPDLKGHIERQGFSAVPWFPDLDAKGSELEIPGRGILAQRRATTERFRAGARQLLQGEGASREIRRLQPDLVVFDINEPLIGFTTRRIGVASVAINTSLPQTQDPYVPPLRSAAAYEPTARGWIRAQMLWRSFLLSRRIAARLAGLGAMCPPYELIRQMAPDFGVAPKDLDCRTVYVPQLQGVPELVLCPAELDFPRPPRAERHYVESFDGDRQEVLFPWERLPPGKPLIYCALGSQPYRPAEVKKLIRVLLAAFAQRPDLHLVIALGPHGRAEEISECPPNAIVVSKAPQLSLLARAQLMITHGGLGSVKECIAFRVPMLVFPLAIDQPGNAARVAHHGLGLMGDIREASVAGLLAMIDRVLHDSSIAARVSAMHECFERTERSERGATILENVIASHRHPATHLEGPTLEVTTT